LKLSAVRLPDTIRLRRSYGGGRRFSEFSWGDFLATCGGESGSDYL